MVGFGVHTSDLSFTYSVNSRYEYGEIYVLRESLRFVPPFLCSWSVFFLKLSLEELLIVINVL